MVKYIYLKKLDLILKQKFGQFLDKFWIEHNLISNCQ